MSNLFDRNRTSSSRRSFLFTSGATAASLTAASWSKLASGASPNERIRVGVIGTGVRGKYLIGNLPETAQVVAICDCAASRMTETLQPRKTFRNVLANFTQNDAADCRQYQDYRHLLEQSALDAVIIATPDHHHVPIAIMALERGLDVYLEKPLSVFIGEGRLLADKVKQTGRILQVGSQQRTMEINRIACEFVRDGGLGRIHRVELPGYPGPISDPQFPAEPIPSGLDWNLFLGPAPFRPHNRHLWVKDDFKVGRLLWRGWDLFRDYSGHIMTNWGAHSVDMMQYALGRDDTGPVSVETHPPDSVDATYEHWSHKTPRPTGPQDRRFWPVTMRYADGVEVVFAGANDPMIIQGELGSIKIRRNFFKLDKPELMSDPPDPIVAERWEGDGHVARPHLQNWLDCIRSRNQPNAPVEVGHRTVTVCHLANLARELNRPLRWDPQNEQFVGDSEANARLLREPRKFGS
ncbi:MAG: Gfo/Idh/MocA family oxidoreductase [Fuerstiella sp.]